MWTPEINDAVYWREVVFTEALENFYLYKETVNLREKTKDVVAKSC